MQSRRAQPGRALIVRSWRHNSALIVNSRLLATPTSPGNLILHRKSIRIDVRVGENSLVLQNDDSLRQCRCGRRVPAHATKSKRVRRSEANRAIAATIGGRRRPGFVNASRRDGVMAATAPRHLSSRRRKVLPWRRSRTVAPRSPPPPGFRWPRFDLAAARVAGTTRRAARAETASWCGCRKFARETPPTH